MHRTAVGNRISGLRLSFRQRVVHNVAVNPAKEEQRQDVASTPVTLGKPELTIPAKRQDLVLFDYEQTENTNLHVIGP